MTDKYELSPGVEPDGGSGDLGGASGLDGTAGSSSAGSGSALAGGLGLGGTDGASGSRLSAGSAGVNVGNAGNAGMNAGSAGNAGIFAVAGSAGASAGAPDSGGSAGSAVSAGSGGADDDAGISGGGGSDLGGSAGAMSCTAANCNLSCCGLSCSDTTRDFQNCGGCGKACNTGRSCSSSVCASGWVSMSTPPVGFAARWRAATVAVGKSVFIWGGTDNSGAVLDSGALYSPITDTWTVIAKDSWTPTARILATAVWTGSVVILFGGSDAAGSTTYKDGALYDPAKDAWSQLSIATNRRASAVGVWDGTQALFYGGIGSSATPVAGADRFDLANWSTSSTSSDPGALSCPAWAWAGGVLYLQGGLLNGTRQDKVFSYTSSTDTWAGVNKSLSARSNAFGTWDGSHFVVWGGRDDSALHSDGKYLAGGTWYAMNNTGAPTARMAVPRRSGWSFEVSPGIVAIFGGQNSLTGQGTLSTTGATYDVGQAKWTGVTGWPSGQAHEYGAAVWTGDEFVLWGGRDTNGPTLTGERWKY